MKHALRNIGLILIGNFLIAFGVSHFVVPAGLISGGATGLSLVLSKLTGLPLTGCIWSISVLFFLLGFFAMGKTYAMTIMLSSVAYPLFYSITGTLAQRSGAFTSDIFLCTAFAGICFGIGIGLVMRAGASTGGSDVVAMFLHKRFGVPLQVTIYLFDALVLCLQVPYSRIDQILYGLLFVMIYTFLLGKVMLFGQNKIQILIYSEVFEQINYLILSDFDKGSTLLHAEGGYSRQTMRVIQSVIPQRSLFSLREAVLRIDPQAFIVINPVSEVNGRGFTLSKQPTEEKTH